MHVIVLGAGLAGVTTAWYLLRDGHHVTLIDRQSGAGLETSFANGGQISVSHPEPWANPQAPGTILRWLGREDAPLKFRPRADLSQWLWGAAFLLECLPARAQRNTEAIAALARYSLEQLRALRAQTGIEYHAGTQGILHLYFDAEEFRTAPARQARLASMGIHAELCPPARCIEIEPALMKTRAPLAGGLYARDDESGDAHLFCVALARLCQQAGATLRLGTQIDRINLDHGQVASVSIRRPDGQREQLRADAYVLAAGTMSAALARTADERLMIYPVKGYSITLPAGPGAPTVSVTDEARRIVFSRLGDRLRIAGTAELASPDTSINPARVAPILRRALEIFPDAGPAEEAQYWAGLRPAVPSNIPYIGRARARNLYLNTGHGTLGWTLACGSAAALADMIAGRVPEVNFRLRSG